MKRAVLVSRDKEQFSVVEQMLSNKKIGIEKIETGKALLSLLAGTTSKTVVDLVIMAQTLEDFQARPLVEAVILQSPFTHCIVSGSMEAKAFHDAFEGYGVLMQIPEAPGHEDAKKIETHLDKLSELSS